VPSVSPGFPQKQLCARPIADPRDARSRPEQPRRRRAGGSRSATIASVPWSSTSTLATWVVNGGRCHAGGLRRARRRRGRRGGGAHSTNGDAGKLLCPSARRVAPSPCSSGRDASELVGVVALEHDVRRVLAERPVGSRSPSGEVRVRNVSVMSAVEVVVGGGSETRGAGGSRSTIPGRATVSRTSSHATGSSAQTEWRSDAAGALAPLGDDERAMRLARDA
jgi:hypothetical protein